MIVLDESGILIRNDVVTKFMSSHGPEVHAALETILEQMCSILALNPSPGAGAVQSSPGSRAGPGALEEKLDSAIEKLERRETSAEFAAVAAALAGIRASLDQHLVTSLVTKNSNQFKGSFAETKLQSALEELLPAKDGYAVTSTKSVAHSCDIRVSRSGFPDVYVESKAYGDKVQTRETRKFESDLVNLNSHGIFVSVHSGIVGRGQIEIDLLSTGKFAVYMSENNYDCPAIVDYVKLIHRLDKLVRPEGSFRLSSESIDRIKNCLADLNSKIASLRVSLKTSTSIVNEMSTSLIEQIIGLGQGFPTESLVCRHCSRELKSKGGLTQHLKTCSAGPGPGLDRVPG